MKSRNDKVSVVITTFNRKELLEKAYQSILNQTYTNVEIIIVDDCSSDDTITFLNSIDEPNTKVILNDSKQGVQVNRNKGLMFATGEFITYLDDDDYYHCDRINVMVKNYDSKYAFVGTLMKNSFNDKVYKCPQILTLPIILWRNPGFHWPLMKRQQLIDVGMFDVNLESAQDYDLWIRLINKYGSAYVVQEALYFFNNGGHDRITNSQLKINGRVKFIKKHKSLMSKKQYSFHKYYIAKMKQKRFSIIDFIFTVPLFLWRYEIGYFLKRYLNA